MKKKLKITLIVMGGIVTFTLLTAIGVQTYNKLARPMVATKSQYRSYKVTKALALSLSGKVVAEKTQPLSLPTGKLQQLNVENGQDVKMGDVLLVMMNTDVQEAFNSQQDVVNKAYRTVNSASAAFKNAQQHSNQAGIETKMALNRDVEQTQQALSEANGALQDAQRKLIELQKNLTIALTAPFNGVVSVSNESKTGLPMITINSDRKVLQANVSEYDYSKLHSGDALNVSSIDGTLKQKTNISKIMQIPANDGKGTAYYPFSADINRDFLYGQSVKVNVPQSQIKIPKSSVYQGVVYKIIDGKASRVQVDVTSVEDGYVVNAGISQGDKIIINPDSKLTTGEVVDD
ncbi:efflux RND transporter periplasmic adaptor subunit [Leuconostoc lactis]|uniref:efflux RND transporter periplasmic adaptor subunit n=1 Tax=Leuconostoc lactis TaxID=1246 RepID=UPI00189A025A|nr:biotin/lipoyl-binding protein [Leuconostoc lactis]